VDHSVLVVASQLDALADLFAYVECGHTSINQSNKQTNKQASKQTNTPPHHHHHQVAFCCGLFVGVMQTLVYSWEYWSPDDKIEWGFGVQFALEAILFFG
jgi:hypothetical protein